MSGNQYRYYKTNTSQDYLTFVENSNKIKGKAFLFDGKEVNWSAKKKKFEKKIPTKTDELNKLA
jgi:hypothetical protein